jgi:hypothetical protein
VKNAEAFTPWGPSLRLDDATFYQKKSWITSSTSPV